MIATLCRQVLLLLAILLSFSAPIPPVQAQTAGHVLFGDVVLEGEESGRKAITVEILLYTMSGGVIGRQTAGNNGRYRFMDLANGYYDLVVMLENSEVARVRVSVFSLYKTDVRQDLNLAISGPKTTSKASTISAADIYQRNAANEALFVKAQKAVDSKKYEQANTVFRQIVDSDRHDFQAWTELGTVYLLQKNYSEAEKAYLRAIEARPTFALALINLGRLSVLQEKFDAAIDPLTRALAVQPESAEANLLLGEVYLQTRQGSKAVGHLNEAVRLGKPEAHLRLAMLYNAAGMKDKAATQYEDFLIKKPDYPDRKKLEQYISAHKKDR